MAMNNLGRVAMIHRGDYSAAYEYVPLDICYFDGSTYLCKEATIGNAPPNAVYWVLMSTSASTLDRDAAEAAALAAQGYASDAADQVPLAEAQVTLAEGHADTAGTKATEAGASASAASGSADAALASAGDADLSAQAAAGSAVDAQGYAQDAANSAASIDTVALMAAIAAKAGKADLPRGNILHNPDFRNPVNQRGATGTISTAGYFLDRWMLNTGSVTIGTGLTFATSAVIEQRIEGLLLAGQEVAIAVQLADGTVKQGTGTFPVEAGTVSVTLTGFGAAILGYGISYMFIRLVADSEVTVLRAKLEMGTVSTLLLDPPVDHATELLKCQRFYQMAGKYTGAAASTSIVLGGLYPVKMRAVPTGRAYTAINGTADLAHIHSSTAGTIPVTSIYGLSDDSFRWLAVTGATAGVYYQYYMQLSADL